MNQRLTATQIKGFVKIANANGLFAPFCLVRGVCHFAFALIVYPKQNQTEWRMTEFVCSYVFDGKTWSITIFATTYEEAEMKLKAIGRGTVDGVLSETIPASD